MKLSRKIHDIVGGIVVLIFHQFVWPSDRTKR